MNYKWVFDSKKQHCPDCYALNGQVRSLDQWNMTIMPGSPKLACRGKKCGCRLEPTSLPITDESYDPPTQPRPQKGKQAPTFKPSPGSTRPVPGTRQFNDPKSTRPVPSAKPPQIAPQKPPLPMQIAPQKPPPRPAFLLPSPGKKQTTLPAQNAPQPGRPPAQNAPQPTRPPAQQSAPTPPVTSTSANIIAPPRAAVPAAPTPAAQPPARTPGPSTRGQLRY